MNEKQYKNRQFHVEVRDSIIVLLCILFALTFSFFANTYRTTEDKFNIEIEDGDLHKLVTVGDVVEYLESL